VPKVTIDSLYNLDGEYDIDLVFTHRDFRDIKKIAGVRANEVMDALNAGDMDIIVALAAIALRRSGKPFDVEQLWDAEAGHIVLDFSDQEVDAGPPPIGSDGSEPESNGDSSPSGTPTSEPTDLSLVSESQSPSGMPAQANSA
jgi:hypothetical protein